MNTEKQIETILERVPHGLGEPIGTIELRVDGWKVTILSTGATVESLLCSKVDAIKIVRYGAKR